MKIERKHSVQLAKELGLPEVVLKILNDDDLPHGLFVYFGCPEEFFLSDEDDQTAITKGHVVPLWDDGNFDRITAYDQDTGKYVMFYVESPEEGMEQHFTYEQLMATEFLDLWNAEKGEEALREIASLFDFRGIEQFIAVMKDLSCKEGAEFDECFGSYRASIVA